MGVKTSHIRPALAANKFHISQDFSRIFFRRKRPIVVLQIMGRDQNILGNFDKIFIITALLTHNASNRFTGGDVDFLHRLLQ